MASTDAVALATVVAVLDLDRSLWCMIPAVLHELACRVPLLLSPNAGHVQILQIA